MPANDKMNIAERVAQLEQRPITIDWVDVAKTLWPFFLAMIGGLVWLLLTLGSKASAADVDKLKQDSASQGTKIDYLVDEMYLMRKEMGGKPAPKP